MGQYTCCCCIPLRAGVLIIALLSAAYHIAATVFLFMSHIDPGTLGETTYKYSVGIKYTGIAVSIIFAMCSLFGVLGCITQHRNMIQAFKVAYWTTAIIQFIESIAVLIILGVERSNFLTDCAANDNFSYSSSCSDLYRNTMIVLAVVLMFICFIQFYFATAISSYATRLRRTNMHEKLRNLEDFPEPPSKTEFF